MKLCVFQGTFNPIHNAHLRMAQYALEHFDFDKILFIPAYRPPHKDYDDTLSPHRLKMTQLAISENSNFEVSDIEYRSEEKSYTYNTIKQLCEIYPIDGKISFIIGTDAFEKIESWYKTDELKKLVDFIVFMRENDFNEDRFFHLSEKDYSFKFAKMDFIDISSTELKEKIKNNHPIGDLVAKKVEYYIKENELYKN